MYHRFAKELAGGTFHTLYLGVLHYVCSDYSREIDIGLSWLK
jgi:hypothetical protein